ncbi:MAG: MoaD/ThiS family protein [Pseudomonadales bacterium]|nr:MoaD/ThiS family protein [Pseudomonadales bacterium]
MAKVFFPDHLMSYCKREREVEVQASTYRELVRKLGARYPGIEEVLLEDVAVAIDGEICHEPYMEKIATDSEVYFLHRLAAG